MLSKLHDKLENLLVLDDPTGIFFKPWVIVYTLLWYTTNFSFSPLSGKDEVNPLFWLANQVGQIGLTSCPLGICCFSPARKNVFLTIQKIFYWPRLFGKMAGYWPLSFSAFLWLKIATYLGPKIQHFSAQLRLFSTQWLTD